MFRPADPIRARIRDLIQPSLDRAQAAGPVRAHLNAADLDLITDLFGAALGKEALRCAEILEG